MPMSVDEVFNRVGNGKFLGGAEPGGPAVEGQGTCALGHAAPPLT